MNAAVNMSLWVRYLYVSQLSETTVWLRTKEGYDVGTIHTNNDAGLLIEALLAAGAVRCETATEYEKERQAA